MFLSIIQGQRLFGSWILVLASLLAACWVSPAASQEKTAEFTPMPAMNYSSENPDWLTFIGRTGKTNGNSWWPTWKAPTWTTPKWKMTGSKKQSSGWWSGSKGVSSYSRNNKNTMQKVSQTSKRWWNNTLEFLDPYAPPKDVSSASQSKPGFFGKMFGGGSQEPEFHSVPEWAGQPMPK